MQNRRSTLKSNSLSNKQKEVLFIIDKHQKENHGQSPTLEEIAFAIKPKVQKPAAWKRVQILIEKEFIDMTDDGHRKIRLTRKAQIIVKAGEPNA